MCAGADKEDKRISRASAPDGAIPRPRAGIGLPFLFHDLLKLKSFYGKFFRQALKQLALFYVRCPLTHQGEFSGVRAEFL